MTSVESKAFLHNLKSFLSQAAVRIERTIAVVRMVIIGVMLPNIVWSRVVGVEHVRWNLVLVALFGFLLGLAFSAWTLITLKSTKSPTARLRASVVIDAVVLATTVLPLTLMANPSYAGLLRSPDAAVLLLATIVTGLRLSRRVVVLGGLCLLAVQIAAITLDLTVYSHIEYSTNTYVQWGAYWTGAMLLAYGIAFWSQRLVHHGARHALRVQRARNKLAVYVSDDVAGESLDVSRVTLCGSRRPIAVLFSDLRKFTTYSESRDPMDLVREINAYFDAMVGAIHAEGGVVDKFVGDAIMAVFGMTQEDPTDAARAVRAAARMHQALREHNRMRADLHLPPLTHGIGVHFGVAVVGDVGSRARMQRTVIGDVVNVAARLESLTKEANTATLISAVAATAAVNASAKLAAPALVSIGNKRLRGRSESVEVFTFAEKHPIIAELL